MPPETVRTLPFGTGVILLRTTRPIVADLRPWTARTDAKQLRDARTAIEQQMRQT